MGRHADPEHIRALKGKKPKIPKDEQIVFPTVVTLVPPPYFTKRAQHHWERMTLIMASAGLLQEVGRDKLGRYCQACADYEEIQEERRKLGVRKTRYDEDTAGKLTFWMRCLKDHSEEMRDFEREYGLTPASAARIRRPSAIQPMTPREEFLDYLEEIPKAN